jgi:hypothetical protein
LNSRCHKFYFIASGDRGDEGDGGDGEDEGEIFINCKENSIKR